IHAAVLWALHGPGLAEAARQLGRGRVTLSDLLRILLVHLFGGLYLDGDLKLHKGLTRDFKTALENAYCAVVLHYREKTDIRGNGKGNINNDLYGGEAGHPFGETYLGDQQRNYRMRQRQLYGSEAHEYVG